MVQEEVYIFFFNVCRAHVYSHCPVLSVNVRHAQTATAICQLHVFWLALVACTKMTCT